MAETSIVAAAPLWQRLEGQRRAVGGDSRMDWSFLDVFRAPEGYRSPLPLHCKPDWSGAMVMSGALVAAHKQIRAEIKARYERSAIEMYDLGGDPQQRDWQRFRALRLRREEDWSDWLAHLLESSRSGIFGYELFRDAVAASTLGDFSTPDVAREVVVGKRRADIVLVTNRLFGVHIEVKIWDRNVGKTKETGDLVAEAFSSAKGKVLRWVNVLLLPDDERRMSSVQDELSDDDIVVIGWARVARCLRRALSTKGADDAQWRVWAWTLVGCIEQRILDLQPDSHPASNPSRAFRFLQHLG